MRTLKKFYVFISFFVLAVSGHTQTLNKSLFGFTQFPPDTTAEAVSFVQQTTNNNSDLYAIHFDDGIPWEEALYDKPLPTSIKNSWSAVAASIPANKAVYLGLAPLAKDRINLAPAIGNNGPASLPPAISSRVDSSGKIYLAGPEVVQAYLNYARRAVQQFHPTFLNLGIEAGELAARGDSQRWWDFMVLFGYVKTALKKEFPNLQIGISFGLQSLRSSVVAWMATPLVNNSDYLGLSFYPYASAFGEKFGAPPFSPPPAAWREPLSWLRTYTSKPIAICETGYTTQNIYLPTYDIRLYGDQAEQASYVRDLIDFTRQDHYLFVVWFLLVDYDRLYAKMPPGSEVNLLWRNVGLFDGNYQPKPAWQEWQAFRNAYWYPRPLAQQPRHHR